MDACLKGASEAAAGVMWWMEELQVMMQAAEFLDPLNFMVGFVRSQRQKRRDSQ